MLLRISVKMSKFWKLLCVVTLCIQILKCADGADIKCSEAFCAEYTSKNKCANIAIACQAQNSTHNGILLDSPIPCNCCKTCLTNLYFNDTCSLGRPGSPPTTSICGPGLICKLEPPEDRARCLKMAAKDNPFQCIIDLEEYIKKREDGTLGHLMPQPLCDRSGYYKPVKCLPGQICYCVSRQGERIFGEAVVSHITELTMSCECGRMADDAYKLLTVKQRTVKSSRCVENGNFDELQCTGDTCTCVDESSGTPTTKAVNITLTNFESMDCFNSDVHNNATYMRSCEARELDILLEIEDLEKRGYGVLDFQLKICQEDGNYHRVQVRDNKLLCVDKYGLQIEDFEAKPGSQEAKVMNCNCARAKLLLLEAQHLEIPECCPNGNYPTLTCRRGLCYCTDLNGMQTEKEVPRTKIDTLSCFNSTGIYC